jgi:hypothetical protein
MAIFSLFLGVGASVIADSACPIISATLSLLTIVVAVDREASVFAFSRSESATLHWACNH